MDTHRYPRPAPSCIGRRSAPPLLLLLLSLFSLSVSIYPPPVMLRMHEEITISGFARLQVSRIMYGHTHSVFFKCNMRPGPEKLYYCTFTMNSQIFLLCGIYTLLHASIGALV